MPEEEALFTGTSEEPARVIAEDAEVATLINVFTWHHSDSASWWTCW